MPGEHSIGSILLVDSDKAFLTTLRTVLETRGYAVRTARDGLSGLAAAQAEHFDLVVLDLDLPGMSGADLVARLRQDKRTLSLPVMVLTALDEGPQRVRLFELGVDDFLAKSASPLEILSRVQALLRRSAEPAAPEPGKVIAFVGCAGGVGTTTICANVAQALGARGTTLALDAGWPLGSLAALLAAPPQAGLRQVAGVDPTPENLSTYLAGGRAGVRFRYLHGIDTLVPGDMSHLDCAGLVKAARELARFVLIDAGDWSAPFSDGFIAQADMVVLVMALERTHIAHMRQYLERLDGLGVRRSRRLLLGNRLRPSPFGIRETQRYLDEDIFLIIPFEGDRLSQCLADGRLLLTQFPESAGAVAIAELASNLSHQTAIEA
jgi:CheY-like chemotaxis protein/MinD-like ATPase involved in chromosome partitioning or flagellar assembly